MPMVITYGVWNFGCTLHSRGGIRWSRDIANTTRLAPIIKVSTTVVRPATAPAAIRVAKPGLPTEVNAEASAAFGSIWSYFTMPVITRATGAVEDRADHQRGR